MRSKTATSNSTTAGFPFTVMLTGLPVLLAWAKMAFGSWPNSSTVLKSSVKLIVMKRSPEAPIALTFPFRS
jgi:hypothetical protein